MKRPLIVWSDPPERRYRKHTLKYEALVHALKENPGRWACLQRSPDRQVIRRINLALRTAAYRRLAHPHRLEVTMRTTDSGDWGIWARLTTPTSLDRNGQPLDIDTNYQEA